MAIGNSQGIRIPRILLEQSGLQGEVELVVDGNQLIIRPAAPPRQGWAEEARLMAERGDDRLILGDELSPSDWDESEWEW